MKTIPIANIPIIGHVGFGFATHKVALFHGSERLAFVGTSRTSASDDIINAHALAHAANHLPELLAALNHAALLFADRDDLSDEEREVSTAINNAIAKASTVTIPDLPS